MRLLISLEFEAKCLWTRARFQDRKTGSLSGPEFNTHIKILTMKLFFDPENETVVRPEISSRLFMVWAYASHSFLNEASARVRPIRRFILMANYSFRYSRSQKHIIFWTRFWILNWQCRLLFLETLHLEAEGLAVEIVVYTLQISWGRGKLDEDMGSGGRRPVMGTCWSLRFLIPPLWDKAWDNMYKSIYMYIVTFTQQRTYL